MLQLGTAIWGPHGQFSSPHFSRLALFTLEMFNVKLGGNLWRQPRVDNWCFFGGGAGVYSPKPEDNPYEVAVELEWWQDPNILIQSTGLRMEPTNAKRYS